MKYQALLKAGTLEQALQMAASLTLREMDELIQIGATAHEAWEQTRQNHLILREEPSSEPEEEIQNPAFASLAETNKMMDELDRQEE